MAVGIEAIMGLITSGGGMAMSNTFKVTFQENQRSTEGSTRSENKVFSALPQYLPGFDRNKLEGDTVGSTSASWISMMCEEATLPGSQFATGQVNGIYTGSGQFNYPHTRIFNDLTLTWLCDANMTPLKFINTWMGVMYDDGYTRILQSDASDTENRVRNRSVRFNYPDEYTMNCTILKAERDKNSQTGRPSIRYVLEGVFPYAVDSVPLSMGSSQLVKVSANFYYERWYDYYTDQWGKFGPGKLTT